MVSYLILTGMAGDAAMASSVMEGRVARGDVTGVEKALAAGFLELVKREESRDEFGLQQSLSGEKRPSVERRASARPPGPSLGLPAGDRGAIGEGVAGRLTERVWLV